MKRASSLAMGLIMLLSLACASLAMATTDGNNGDCNTTAFISRVVATVSPFVSIGNGSEGSTTVGCDEIGLVNLGPVCQGNLAGHFSFPVLGNTQAMSFYVTATDLFKGGDPASAAPSIPVNQDFGVLIEPTNATEYYGGSNRAMYNGSTSDIYGLTGYDTETLTFEGSTPCSFNQPVNVTVKWLLDNPTQPTGQYMGYVRLTAMTFNCN